MKGGTQGQNFLADYHNYAQTVWPIATKFGTLTHVVSSVFLRASHAGASKVGGAPASAICGTCYMRAHSSRYNNQILHSDQTTREDKFYTIDHECW